MYAIVTLTLTAVALVWIGYYVAAPLTGSERALTLFELSYPRDRNFLLWIGIALAGVAGGASFDLKWLYHSVAKWTWNRDRLLWRLMVPPLSGTLAVFVSMMVRSGVVPLLDAKLFSSFYGGLGTAYLIGYFSDNVLAALQNLAVKWFGTVDKRVAGQAHPLDDPAEHQP